MPALQVITFRADPSALARASMASLTRATLPWVYGHCRKAGPGKLEKILAEDRNADM